ncbi:MAG TPA: alpha/beta hydrolase [Solimonas sp.]|nr:alpha/beta hydrolase [Solimonas sp.]
MRLVLRLVVLLVLLGGGLVAFDRFLPAQAADLGLRAERAQSQLEEKRLKIDGFDIAYLEGGQGEPLVLVHGIGADKDNFTRVARWLTPYYRVIAIDLPGFGESGKPGDADYGIPAQAERLDQIMQALNLSRAHFGGSSMGGWIIATYAAKYPNKVGSLWLLGAAGTDGGKPTEVRKAWERGEYLLFAKTPEEFERTIDFVFVKRPFLPYSVRQVMAQQAIGNYELHTRIFGDLMKNWSDYSVNAKIRGLPVPALIVFGDQDRAVDPGDGIIWQSLLPQSQLEMMQDIGHLPMAEAPQVVAQRYLAFRKSLPRS